MAGYFEEMGWGELAEGEGPNYLDVARFLLDYGIFEDNNGQWPRLPPPASKEIVNNLPEVVIDTNDKNCSICLKKYDVGDKVKEMPCHHQFHSLCIVTWLEKTNSCPFCRHELPTDNEAYEAFKKEKKRAVEREKELEMLHNSMYN